MRGIANNKEKEIERRKKISNKLKGHKAWNKDLTKETDIRVKQNSDSIKLSKQERYRPWSEESKKRFSEKKKLEYQTNPLIRQQLQENSIKGNKKLMDLEREFPNRKIQRIAKTMKACGKGCSKIEKEVMKELDKLEIQYKYQEPVCSYFVDIFIDSKLIIECDGDYWHSLPKIQLSDKKKNEVWKENGYIVLRFSETQIETNLSKVIDTIIKERNKLPP